MIVRPTNLLVNVMANRLIKTLNVQMGEQSSDGHILRTFNQPHFSLCKAVIVMFLSAYSRLFQAPSGQRYRQLAPRLD